MQQAINNLISVLNQLSPKDLTFAQSLITQARTRVLSPKQMYWVEKLYQNATQPKPAPIVLKVDKMLELISRNNKAKWPKIKLLVNGETIVISRAGERARFPGSLNIVGQGREWLGRIHTDGKFEPSRKIEQGRIDLVLTELRRMGDNPSMVASEYGKLTGHCCFCSLALNDARSLEVGYGPVCAEHYQLPWGKVA